ncbi:MAG TPA: hypothetical protein VNR89_11850 [Roseomonas sp.]|nr:hypothetical protein [Roseomonas sp.]
MSCVISFPFRPELVELRRQIAPRARWDGRSKAWTMETWDAEKFLEAVRIRGLSDGLICDGVEFFPRRQRSVAQPRYQELERVELGTSVLGLLDEVDGQRCVAVRPKRDIAAREDRQVLLSLGLSRSYEWLDGDEVEIWAANAKLWPRILAAFGVRQTPFAGVRQPAPAPSPAPAIAVVGKGPLAIVDTDGRPIVKAAAMSELVSWLAAGHLSARDIASGGYAIQRRNGERIASIPLTPDRCLTCGHPAVQALATA